MAGHWTTHNGNANNLPVAGCANGEQMTYNTAVMAVVFDNERIGLVQLNPLDC